MSCNDVVFVKTLVLSKLPKVCLCDSRRFLRAHAKGVVLPERARKHLSSAPFWEPPSKDPSENRSFLVNPLQHPSKAPLLQSPFEKRVLSYNPLACSQVLCANFTIDTPKRTLKTVTSLNKEARLLKFRFP